jgi:hypothetical protein
LISIQLYFILTILITEDIVFFLIRERPQKNLLHTSLTPSLFFEVPELSQEGSFKCVLDISNLHISKIFLESENRTIFARQSVNGRATVPEKE